MKSELLIQTWALKLVRSSIKEANGDLQLAREDLSTISTAYDLSDEDPSLSSAYQYAYHNFDALSAIVRQEIEYEISTQAERDGCTVFELLRKKWNDRRDFGS